MRTGALLLMVLSAAVFGQDIRGDWRGALEVQNDAPLRLALHITLASSGRYRVTLDSVDEDGATLPVDSFTVIGSSVKFEMKDIGGIYEGKISANGSSVDGVWRQNGGTWPLDMGARRRPGGHDRPDRRKHGHAGRSRVRAAFL